MAPSRHVTGGSRGSLKAAQPPPTTNSTISTVLRIQRTSAGTLLEKFDFQILRRAALPSTPTPARGGEAEKGKKYRTPLERKLADFVAAGFGFFGSTAPDRGVEKGTNTCRRLMAWLPRYDLRIVPAPCARWGAGETIAGGGGCSPPRPERGHARDPRLSAPGGKGAEVMGDVGSETTCDHHGRRSRPVSPSERSRRACLRSLRRRSTDVADIAWPSIRGQAPNLSPGARLAEGSRRRCRRKT